MPLAHGPRVDAAADGADIGIGGWLPQVGADGKTDTARSPWFAIRLTRAEAPWAFAKGGQPFRTIASLEALGTLLAVRLFSPWLAGGMRGTVTLRAFTDNQGNVSALSKLMTTKFPLNCVIMEVATLLEELSLRLDLHWLPRDRNEEADRLSKGCYDGFNPENRVGHDAASLHWNSLPDLMSLGEDLFRDMQQRALHDGRGPRRKRRRGERLRDKDPW